jgi:nicotinamidase-related amidase
MCKDKPGTFWPRRASVARQLSWQLERIGNMGFPTLILIDMQRAMESSALPKRNNPNAEKMICKLLEAWRNRGRLIVHVRHISRDPESLFWPGQVGVEFQVDLSPLSSEHVVEKNVPDAFANTGLERWLHARGVESVVVVGVSTNNSVEATARSAGNLGFKTYVVADATFTFAKVDYSGVLRSAEDVHAMSLANLEGEYANIVNTSELLNAP